VSYLPEDDVPPVEPGAEGGGDEELGLVRVGAWMKNQGGICISQLSIWLQGHLGANSSILGPLPSLL
jgi:hypothetical protein